MHMHADLEYRKAWLDEIRAEWETHGSIRKCQSTASILIVLEIDVNLRGVQMNLPTAEPQSLGG